MRPIIIINNFLHCARVLGDACEKLRRFPVEGTRLDRKRIDDTLGRSLMLVTALSPVIGCERPQRSRTRRATRAHLEGGRA